MTLLHKTTLLHFPWSWVGSRIPLLFLPLIAAACLISYYCSVGHDQGAVRWWVQVEVEAGIDQEEGPESFDLGKNGGALTPWRMWRGCATHLLILLGTCRRVQIRATSQDILAFIEACRHAYTALGEQERILLDPYRTIGSIPEAVLRRQSDRSDVRRHEILWGQRLPQNGTEARRLPLEGLVEVLGESHRAGALAEVITSPPEELVNYLSLFDLREVPVIPSDWAAVGHAVRRSRIVRFDSTPLLPRELFNMSMEQLARDEGPAAERIPVFSDSCTPLSLRRYAAFAESHVRSGKRNAFTLAHWGRWGLPPPRAALQKVIQRIEATSLEASDATLCGWSNVNARRLPKFFSRLPPGGLAPALGLGAEVLRELPILWLGPTAASSSHHDEEYSIYIQLSGHSDVMLFPHSTTDFWVTSPTLISFNHPALRMVPFSMVHLKPGDGLVLPGRSHHAFDAQSSDRIALSVFLQPRWRRMEFSKDDWYSREAAKELGLEHLALRQLYFRSLIHLYEKTGKAIAFMTSKQELI